MTDAHSDASHRLAVEYSAMAGDYTRHWAPVIHPMAGVVLGSLPLAQARDILDVGCGTGNLLADLRTSAPHARLIGVDRAEGMVRVARREVSGDVLVTDAAQLALRAQSFDVALMAFMLFHVPDAVAALGEVLRILRPNGCVGIVTWGQDPGMPGAAIWKEELDAVGAPEDSRDASVMGHIRMDTLDKLAGLLREAGFAPERLWDEGFAHTWTVDDLLEMQTRCGMPARRLAGLSKEAQAKCCERVRSRVESLVAEDLVYRAEVLFAVARRPSGSVDAAHGSEYSNS